MLKIEQIFDKYNFLRKTENAKTSIEEVEN